MELKTLQKFREGEETILTDCLRDSNFCIVIGDTKIDGKYRIMVAKITAEGKILWSKNYGDEDEYEAQTIMKIHDGYLIAGNAHGHATKEGGEDWQAYILLVDEEGNKIAERSYEIGENAAIYHVVEKDGAFYCLGESSENGKKFIFRIKLNQELKMEDVKKYESCEDVLTGGMSEDCIAYSCKEGKWFGKVKCRGWKRDVKDFIIYDLKESGDFILLAGSRKNKGYVLKMSKDGEIIEEKSFGQGTVTSIEINDEIIAAGEENGHPVAYVLDSSLHVLDSCMLDVPGWFEKVFIWDKKQIIMLAYSSNTGEAMIVEGKMEKY